MEINSLEIWDKSGNLIVIISPMKNLTEVQISAMMLFFEGDSNSESWYDIKGAD